MLYGYRCLAGQKGSKIIFIALWNMNFDVFMTLRGEA